MEARLNMMATPVGSKFIKYLVAADRALAESALPTATRHLVQIRASQINGCGFCTDMHTKDAIAAGESQERLNLVAAWRESGLFTAAERAALEMTEQATRIADAGQGATDEVWAAAAEHFDEDQLAALVGAIALINAFNTGNVLVKTPAGDYQPGQFA